MGILTKVIFASICVAFLAVYWTTPSFHAESLRGVRVVVTGASKGIGEQLAYHYARFGAQIVITARREEVLRKVADTCLSLGAQRVFYVAADMSNESDPEKVVDFALEKLGGLDHVVLNHIGASTFAMWDGDVEHARLLMKVNFFSYVQMAWRAMAALEKSKGSLIVVSSLAGKLANPFVAPYASTKFALTGFFGVLQHELAIKRSNVSISICTLGLIDTESAMSKVRDVVKLPAYPATDAALNIIITGATRQTDLFYPWYTSIMILSKELFPSIADYAIQNSHNYIP
ncbi:hydroxysteroid 11-beta-dehydrogenase 1-like protein [Brachionichthys hirsutus]|uniref:hydroxysteroid 11-beta-dehydrogenase 1-like protein n=1 Tax=Brachionichthys hirsutus TaxID=412623 RepID=UPI0036051812